jgi:hypothetical protein
MKFYRELIFIGKFLRNRYFGLRKIYIKINIRNCVIRYMELTINRIGRWDLVLAVLNFLLL